MTTKQSTTCPTCRGTGYTAGGYGWCKSCGGSGEAKEVTPKQQWDTWLTEHRKTCGQCRLSYEEMEGSICVAAFDKFKELLKEEK